MSLSSHRTRDSPRNMRHAPLSSPDQRQSREHEACPSLLTGPETVLGTWGMPLSPHRTRDSPRNMRHAPLSSPDMRQSQEHGTCPSLLTGPETVLGTWDMPLSPHRTRMPWTWLTGWQPPTVSGSQLLSYPSISFSHLALSTNFAESL